MLTCGGLLPAARITQPPPGNHDQQEGRVACLLARQAQPPQLQQGVRLTDPARFSILYAQCDVHVVHSPSRHSCGKG